MFLEQYLISEYQGKENIPPNVRQAVNELTSRITKQLGGYFYGRKQCNENDLLFLYEKIDILMDCFARETAQSNEENIACGSGCYYCCISEEISISEIEGVALVSNIMQMDIVERGEVISAIAVSESTSASNKRRITCPLLGSDGKCKVYNCRPISCRCYAGTSAEKCHSHACGNNEPLRSLRYPLVLKHALYDMVGINILPQHDLNELLMSIVGRGYIYV